METTLVSEQLKVNISSMGGELVSIEGRNGQEYLWQGNPEFWSGRAPHLFPFVGRLTQGKYLLDGTAYEMATHGFWRRTELNLLTKKCGFVSYFLKSSDDTRNVYPRDFYAEIAYKLQNDTIHITFAVKNTDQRPMYFGYGAHPGFFVPMSDHIKFEDYSLVFSAPCSPVQVGMSDSCFVVGPDQPIVLQNEVKLPLRHELFDRDALIMKNMAHQVTVASPKGGPSITITYPHMDYLALWQRPKCQAPYLCIEPWTSLPSRLDVVEDLKEKSDLITLLPGKEWCCSWSIQIQES